MTPCAESIFRPTEFTEPYAVRPSSVIANLSYLESSADRPNYAHEPPPGIPWESCAYVKRAMPIRDARRIDRLLSRRASNYGVVLTDTAVREQVTRCSIINVWRSINGPVLDAPLDAPLRESIELRCLVTHD